MNKEWSLDEIYKGLDDPGYEADFAALEGAIDTLAAKARQGGNMDQAPDVEALLLAWDEVVRLSYRIGVYLNLRQSVNTEDGDIMAQQARLRRLFAKSAPAESAVKKLLATIPDVEAVAAESELMRSFAFLLKENKEEAKHLFSDEVEEMISSMNMTGGAAWSQLSSYLTSTVPVSYRDGKVTLPEIRNMAYSPDREVRKDAYEAELAAYEKIEDAMAFSLNHIKAQVTMLCEKRGYESPLAMTLDQAKMSRETLDAMLGAIREYLPVFHRYLRKKGELLGHKNGLPWYELFAPLGEGERSFTPQEAKEYLSQTFEAFSPDMAEMMREAFEHSWIDFYPRKGKEGGAFCAGVIFLKQSRILTNFDGSFNAVRTLAHELGHAYHNRQLEEVRTLNYGYPMPVAETASTFNEIHLSRNALKTAEGGERLALLESDLMDMTQSIVDIYSRYLFETEVFDRGRDKFLMASDLKAIMADAQRKAYGDGLDEKFLHPYMWACKSHYYSEELSFYNFPYAFGLLFATGLYSLFLKEGKAFVPKYKAMLNATACCRVEEAGALMGLDLTKKEFWKEGLAQIADLTEEFCRM